MAPPPSIRLVTLSALAGLWLAASLASMAQADKVPKLAGSWTWAWKDTAGETHRHVLEVEGLGTKIAARERFDDLPAVRVTDLKLDGKTIRFTVVRGDRRAEYQGVVADDDRTINGTVTVTVTAEGQTKESPWKATHEESVKQSIEEAPAEK